MNSLIWDQFYFSFSHNIHFIDNIVILLTKIFIWLMTIWWYLYIYISIRTNLNSKLNWYYSFDSNSNEWNSIKIGWNPLPTHVFKFSKKSFITFLVLIIQCGCLQCSYWEWLIWHILKHQNKILAKAVEKGETKSWTRMEYYGALISKRQKTLVKKVQDPIPLVHLILSSCLVIVRLLFWSL